MDMNNDELSNLEFKINNNMEFIENLDFIIEDNLKSKVSINVIYIIIFHFLNT